MSTSTPMKVFVADKLEERALRALEAAGFSVVSEPQLAGVDLESRLRDHQPAVLVVRSTKVTSSMMDASGGLELIVRAGAGYDNIDVAAASSRGIFVSNCPGKNAVAVAELAMGLILALDRRIADNVSDARAGVWNKAKYSNATGLKGRTLGIVGLGNIGLELAKRARAFDLKVKAWSRSLTSETAASLGVEYVGEVLDIAAGSDIVSVHLAASPETRNLASREFFAKMCDGGTFINTARSSIVDEEALLWAMETKGILAGLDVVADEPSAKEGPFAHPLARHPNVYLTHHIGASTAQAQNAIADEAVRVVRTYAESGKIANGVNIAARTAATHQLTVRHMDRVGVLAAILDECRSAGWNVQEMENLVFEGGQAACARIRFDGSPTPAVLDRISANQNVLALTLIEL